VTITRLVSSLPPFAEAAFGLDEVDTYSRSVLAVVRKLAV